MFFGVSGDTSDLPTTPRESKVSPKNDTKVSPKNDTNQDYLATRIVCSMYIFVSFSSVLKYQVLERHISCPDIKLSIHLHDDRNIAYTIQ